MTITHIHYTLSTIHYMRSVHNRSILPYVKYVYTYHEPSLSMLVGRLWYICYNVCAAPLHIERDASIQHCIEHCCLQMHLHLAYMFFTFNDICFLHICYMGTQENEANHNTPPPHPPKSPMSHCTQYVYEGIDQFLLH